MTFEKTLAWLRGRNIVVYDLELETAIDSMVRGEKAGWNRLDLLEVSVGCLFDYLTGDTSVYFKEDLQRLVDRINGADLVVGFNTKGFDNPLLRARGFKLKPDSELPNYDILEATRRGLGWTEGARFPRGCKLDEHLLGMFGRGLMKTGDGALAPQLWKDGKKGEVITYCLADVRRERMVFESIWLHGSTTTPTNGRTLVKHPSYFMKGLLDAAAATTSGPVPGLPISPGGAPFGVGSPEGGAASQASQTTQ